MGNKEEVTLCVKTSKQIEKKNLCAWEKRKMLYKTQTQIEKPIDNLITDEKLSSSHCSENTDSNAARITGSNAVRWYYFLGT